LETLPQGDSQAVIARLVAMVCQQSKSMLFSAIVAVGVAYVSSIQLHAPLQKDLDLVTALVAPCFRQLDVDSDQKLNQKELRRVAEQLGFSGTDAEWSNDYKLLAEDRGFTDAGMDLAAFETFVNGTDALKALCPDASQDTKQDPQMIMEDASQVIVTAPPKATQDTKEDPQIDAAQGIKQDANAIVSNAKQDIKQASLEAPTQITSQVTKWNPALSKNDEGLALENMAAPGKYINVEGNRKHNGARIQLWNAGTEWRLEKVEGKVATYTVQSGSAPGMYLSAIATELSGEVSIQLWDNATSPSSQWRVQNVAGEVDAYTLQNVNAGTYLINADSDNLKLVTASGNQSRGASVRLGEDSSLISAHWTIHAIASRAKSREDNSNATIQGVWRSVKGCWDVNGQKIHSGSCEPTPSPTPKPTKAPTAVPTPAPTVKAHWAVRMSCEDAHGNRLDPKNCMKIRNRHSVEGQHHKTR